jgi:hypothetical protein
VSDEVDALLRQDLELVRAKINSETAKIPWLDLQRFFAQGKVMSVSVKLDLVEVACAVQRDDIDSVRAWAENGQVAPVSDDQARGWVESEASLWAVVVKPWVLVQNPGE